MEDTASSDTAGDTAKGPHPAHTEAKRKTPRT